MRTLGDRTRDPGHPQLPRLRRLSPPVRIPRCAHVCARRRATRWSIHVSNFRPVKRVDVASRCSARIRRRCGRASCSSATARFEATSSGSSREPGSIRTCRFLGEQHDLVPCLSVADLFLLPSAQESFGLAALEAMACEVPVVASSVGGLPEIIEDGVTGFVWIRTRSTRWPTGRCSPHRPGPASADGPCGSGRGPHDGTARTESFRHTKPLTQPCWPDSAAAPRYFPGARTMTAAIWSIATVAL